MEMVDFNELFQSADWKKEKHVPVIEIIGECKKGTKIQLKFQIGKEIPHPNTTEHHIEWIDIYFLPNEEKYPYRLGKAEFNAHGASVQGGNTSTIYCEPEASINFKTEKSGKIIAFSYCNIHGLWQNSKELKLN